MTVEKRINIKKIRMIIWISFLFFICPVFVGAVNQLDVVINKIAWMGIAENTYAEWLELYNNTGDTIDLNGYFLVSDDGGINIKLEGEISPNGYYFLLKNTSGKVPDIIVSQIYKSGSMKNDGEYLILKDSSGIIIDEIDCSGGWFAGNNTEKLPMERINVLASGKDLNNWRTKGEEDNSVETENYNEEEEDNGNVVLSSPSVSGEVSQDSSQTQNALRSVAGENVEVFTGQELLFDSSYSEGLTEKSKFFWNFGDGEMSKEKKIYHSYQYPGEYIASLKITLDNFSDTAFREVKVIENNIVISELMPDVQGKDDHEWIEIYNKKEQMSDISGWEIDDEDGGSSPFVFPENTFISAGGYLVLDKKISKINLNNSDDSARIFTSDGVLVDEISYSETYEGQSLNRTSSISAVWSVAATPGKKNIVIEEANKQMSVLMPRATEVSLKKRELSSRQPLNIVKSLSEESFDNFVIFHSAQAAENNLDLQEVDVYDGFSASLFGISTDGENSNKNNNISVVPSKAEIQDNKAGSMDLVVESASVLANNSVVLSQDSSQGVQNDSNKNNSTLIITFCIGALGAFALGYVDRKIKKS